MITPGRLLYLLRRDLTRGYRAAWHDYITAPKILNYRRPDLPSSDNPVPVHILTSKDDWLLALWTLASFHHFTRRAWPIVLHDDGSLPESAADAFCRAFPGLQRVPRREADIRLQRLLAPFPRSWHYRQTHPLGLKIFDMPALARAERFIILDSDLLFFAPPTELLDWVDSKSTECRFMEDVAEASNVSPDEARAKLGVELWPRVNSGLCLVHTAAIDHVFCERILRDTAIANGHIWRIEQTLFALCASRYGRGGLLPRTYEVTLAANASPGTIARHYVGAVRQRFYAEGLARLSYLPQTGSAT